MSRRSAYLSVMFLVFLATSSFAQGKPPWVVDVERVFQQKESQWRVESLNVNDTDPNHFRQEFIFRSGKTQAGVSISIWRRTKDAEDTFAGEAIAFNKTMGKSRVRSRLSDLGDESYIWTNRGSVAWPMLRFRKGHVNVQVFAPTVAIARRFAQHIIERIPPA